MSSHDFCPPLVRDIEPLTYKLGRPHSKSVSSGPNMNPNFPPPKTDKPRPHVCATCTRSFARLEHLKRHERSHTKEKPFACPECTRCFARRDLLLRHQQKLHMTALPASRQRGSRRESTSSTAPGNSGRVRKNSMANNASSATVIGSMRPRANTISHVDNTTLGMLAAANLSGSRNEAMGFGMSSYTPVGNLPGVGNYYPRGMSTAAGHHGNPHVLPKLETRNHGMDLSSSLRTAPPIGGFGGEMDIDSLWFGSDSGSTVNPAQLHYSPHFCAFEEQSPFQQGFPSHGSMDDGTFSWLPTFDNQMSFNEFNEQAIDESSPSAHSADSPEDINESMFNGPYDPVSTPGTWQNSLLGPAQLPPGYPMDISGPPFPDFYTSGPLSPKSFNTNPGSNEQFFSSPQPFHSQTPVPVSSGANPQYFHNPLSGNPETPTNSAASITSSNRQSSVTSVSTNSITDATRQALLTSLSHPSIHAHGAVKSSQPQVSSPLSSGFSDRPQSVGSIPLPSTQDLQRYVTAYIQYFHPHLPFLHIPSLSFDSPAFTSNLGPCSGNFEYGQSSITGGDGTLILAMAAIGALYEYEVTVSNELFELAKKMIQLYLEERRKADMSAALNSKHSDSEGSAQNTPLWLVQAMMLNVIYGHNCGDKTLAGIASTHCAALVNLARAADLTKPLPSFPCGVGRAKDIKQEDTHMSGNQYASHQRNEPSYYGISELQNEWHYWKLGEERKRTLYAVFVLSSLCVSAYNHAPALMNSEIDLELPCEESLWSAESAESWRSMGGQVASEQRGLSFASALSYLLTASQRTQQRNDDTPPFPSQFSATLENLPTSDIQPSTFGCNVLINALHNYIWETRQRHMGRHWTAQETEAMHAHIEPALKAWLAAWARNPEHSIERPNPFGATTLSADCIPYLDLAYVRLFVNLGRSKEAFFQRDFGAMAEELARGSEIIQHADISAIFSNDDSAHVPESTDRPPGVDSTHIKIEDQSTIHDNERGHSSTTSTGHCTKRERHLRKAAIHAIHALTTADSLGISFADCTSRELPLQSGLCVFDCAQVLAEWASTVQERIGRYLGILGKDAIDLSQVPAIMLLEDEDLKLLQKIDNVLVSAETKLAASESMDSVAPTSLADNSSTEGYGCGSKILLVHARIFEKAAVWPSKPRFCDLNLLTC